MTGLELSRKRARVCVYECVCICNDGLIYDLTLSKMQEALGQ